MNDNAAMHITCTRCGRSSHHPVDMAERYCVACHDWTGGVVAVCDCRPGVVRAPVGGITGGR